VLLCPVNCGSRVLVSLRFVSRFEPCRFASSVVSKCWGTILVDQAQRAVPVSRLTGSGWHTLRSYPIIKITAFWDFTAPLSKEFPKFRHIVVISSSEPSWDCLTLKITALRLFETSATKYLTTYLGRVVYMDHHLHTIKFHFIHKLGRPTCFGIKSPYHGDVNKK
jgi:hypothetical protein